MAPSSPVAIHDERPCVTKWSLHTLGGYPVLKLECDGGTRAYKAGDILSHDDMQWSSELRTNGRAYQFRGEVLKAFVELKYGKVFQRFEIAVEMHAAIASGAYKQRGVLKAGSDYVNAIGEASGWKAITTSGRLAAAKPPAWIPSSQDAPPLKTRRIDLSQE